MKWAGPCRKHESARLVPRPSRKERWRTILSLAPNATAAEALAAILEDDAREAARLWADYEPYEASPEDLAWLAAHPIAGGAPEPDFDELAARVEWSARVEFSHQAR